MGEARRNLATGGERGPEPGSGSPSLCFVSLDAYRYLNHDPLGFGGAETQQIQLGTALSRRGVDVCFVSYAEGLERVEVKEGLRFWTVPPSRHSLPSRILGRAFPDLWRGLRRADAEVYFQRCAGTLTGIVGAFARLHSRPFLYSVANDRDLDGRFERSTTRGRAVLYRMGLRLASQIVIQTEHQRLLLRERWGREGVLIPSACPLPLSPPSPAAERQGVLWVANLLPRKRPEIALDVAAALPGVSFTLIAPAIGERGFAQPLLDRIARQPNVHRLNAVPHAEMSTYYRKAAILLSTSNAEGFPNVFLEAWANRTPVVSLEIDPDEILCRKGLGLHARTVDELVRVVQGLLSDPEEREAIGRRGEAYVRANHAPETVVARYERLIDELIGAGGGRAEGGTGRSS
jgi:glycosyltransferase involved in cell wall biosynthesis